MHSRDKPAASPHRSVDEASRGRRALRSDRTGQGRRQSPLDLLGQPLHVGGVFGEEGVRLHVEEEAGRGALDPEPGHLLGGEPVVGGVGLYQGDLAGVEAEPGLRALRLGRVELPALDERLVCPGGGTDEEAYVGHEASLDETRQGDAPAARSRGRVRSPAAAASRARSAPSYPPPIPANPLGLPASPRS